MASSSIALSVIRGGASAPAPASGVGACAYLDWDARKREVLSEFTLTGKLSVASSFLTDEGDSEVGGGEEVSALPLAKARARLEALEAAARGGARVEMTQAEYERRIGKLQKDLVRAWDGNERVTSLKIAIQCSKLLGEPRVPFFYPSVFVLVSDTVDAFGRLVFKRLKAVALEEQGRMGDTSARLPDDFAAGDVSAEAWETCRNWIYKTACIRELLPRLYIEMALLECYRFMHAAADFAPIILRLSHSIRGIENPLVAVYARWYLARQAARLVRDPVKLREVLLASVTDYLHTFSEMAAATAAANAPGAPSPRAGSVPPVELDTLLRLQSPAVAWLMSAVGAGAPKEVFQAVLATYRDTCGHSMPLRHIIDGFDGAHWASHLAGMLQLVKDATPPTGSAEGGAAGAAAAAAAASTAELYRAMASAMVSSPPPDKLRIPFLNEAWKAITRVGDSVTFARHAAALVELLLAAYSEREVLLLLADLCKRLTAAGVAVAAAEGGVSGGGGRGMGGGGGTHVLAPAGSLPHLERLLTVLVEAEARRLASSSSSSATEGGAFGGIMTSEYFSKLLDMFSSDAKPALCRRLLGVLVAMPGKIADAVVINTMFEVARTVHGDLDALSSEEETNTTCALLCAFLDKVDFGRDMERTLEVFSACRQAFTNFDAVKARLVENTLGLADSVLAIVRGRHTPKTGAFVRSVIAAAAITIPAIDDPLLRLRLSIDAGAAALRNACVAQADALFRSSVQELPDLPAARAIAAALSPSGSGAPSSTPASLLALDASVVSAINKLASAVVAMPGHPDLGPFYLVKGIAAAAAKYPWSPSPPASTARVRVALSALLPLLRAYGTDPLPVRIAGVDSNDVLYAGDTAYAEELRTLHRATLEGAVTALGEAATGGHGGVVLDVVPELLSDASLRALLAFDLEGAVAPLERACLLLKAAAPAHPALGPAIATVGAAMRRGAGGGA